MPLASMFTAWTHAIVVKEEFVEYARIDKSNGIFLRRRRAQRASVMRGRGARDGRVPAVLNYTWTAFV